MNNRKEFHSLPDFENPTVMAINRAPAHTAWGAYASEADAAAYLRGSSVYTQSLNGEYNFRLYNKPEAVDDFYTVDYNASGFSKITVPGNWETQGFGKPIYTNYAMPWSMTRTDNSVLEANIGKEKVPNPPFIPTDNPTGCYRRSFTIPQSFDGREVFLRFDGVETAYYLWINGKPVGYSQDSKLPSEFNITSYIQPGENLMALQVMKFADSTYMEDQDYWYLCGIYRSVWLISKPKLHISDCKITAIPDLHSGCGAVSADVTVSREIGFADCTVKVAAYSPNGEKIAENIGNIEAAAEYRTDIKPTANTGRVTLKLPNVQLWNTNTPVLYTIVTTLIAADGTELDYESSRIGFKKIEVIDGVIHLNGERLVIHGVNRHEHFWRTGRTLTREHMLEEIRQMKRMNINAVRTSHYPNAPEWYDLCDEYGILLVCECNLETHALMGGLTHNPNLATQFLERAVRMVQNYKNHVSIYSWSLGNESGTGANHAAMYGFIKEYDHTRLCQYEAGNPAKNISDVRGFMYATIENILKMLCNPKDSRPIILVEYLYQIRNSGGGMDEFMALVEKYPRFQGGFIWDWQDKCLCGKDENGKEFFAYGGDFDEDFLEPREPLFMTNNGIVLPDLTWKPVAYEVRAAYCPVFIRKPQAAHAWFTTSDWDEFVVRHVHSGHTNFNCTAFLRENGSIVAEKAIELPAAAPNEEASFRCEIPYNKLPGCEYTIEFSLTQKGDTFYAENGYELACYQFSQESGSFVSPSSHSTQTASAELKEEDDKYIIVSEHLRAAVCKKTAQFISLEKDGVNYVQGGGTPCLNRPLTGMDAREGWGWFEEYEKARKLKFSVSNSSVMSGEKGICIEFDFTMGNAKHSNHGYLRYLFSGSSVEIDFNINTDPIFRAIPRMGIEFIIPQGFEALEYFGYGPVENYADRHLASKLAVYNSTVEEQHFPFVPPAENGGHEATRWLTLAREDGCTLRIHSASNFHFDAHHNTVEEYINATHEHKLIRRPETILHIDAAHGPIGSEMAWSIAMPEKYKVAGGREYHLRFVLEVE